MKNGTHVRIRAAKLPEAVGAIGRMVDEMSGEVRLTPPLVVSAGATIYSIWVAMEDLEVIEPTARHQTIMVTVDDLARAFLYYDRKEDESLPCGAVQDAIAAGEVTVDEIVERFREHLNRAEEKRCKRCP